MCHSGGGAAGAAAAVVGDEACVVVLYRPAHACDDILDMSHACDDVHGEGCMLPMVV